MCSGVDEFVLKKLWFLHTKNRKFAVSIICIGFATFLGALRQFLAYRYRVVESSLSHVCDGNG